MPLITPLYATLAAVILIVLALRVIGARRSRRVAIGDGADDDLARRIRAHGNFTEYAPLALVLELGGAEIDAGLQGRSWVPLLEGARPADWRTSVLIEHHSDPESYLGRSPLRRALNMGYKAVRTDRYKYIQYTDLRGMDELYELDADPYELENLIDRAASAALLEVLQTELSRLLAATQ